ncbi:GntR family transcriptional regulator [Hyphomicrobiales bacterium]|nr:GntR family transcriptional regulator [Hyphomicrobiales bacterium]CAH1697788.1 GntR family transcriptional regulator [Hyphomicrobiales bacterium]CAI0347434.1 GntR family transcriptional regulator, rspAB operon transcriptional repressor [Hyphomicrobiales bacterium]
MSLSLASPAAFAGVSAAGRVEAELRRAIIALELPPGTRLSEQEIALKYGVSRQPVREALIALARTRLVDVQPQRGTVVVKFSVRKMMEARFVREAVEVAIVREACSSFSAQSRQRISDLLEVQESAAQRDDHAAFQRYDELFHVELTEGVGMPLAWEAIRDIKAHMDRVCQLTLPGRDAMLPLVAQHRGIMAAIDAGDAAAAQAAMRHHLTEILRALPKTEVAHPDLFE